MPELPEVEVIVRELRKKVLNEEIVDIKVHWPKSLVTDGLARRSVCSTIKSVRRYGKFIIFQLDHLYMLVHLRMTGRLIVSNAGRFDKAQLRVQLKFRSGKSLLFYDTRKFGRVYLTADANMFLGSLGVDALDTRFSAKNFKVLLGNKTGIIKPFLLDQRQLAGLGNIYADESLFRAGVHPQRRISSLSVKEMERLYRAIRRVLLESIKHMGTTLADYRTTGGESGRNQNYLRVYGREQNPCVRCKNPIEKKWIGGRGTHFCPVCQPLRTVRT
jgi:formamidopyrimidine-DNA glycosylase